MKAKALYDAGDLASAVGEMNQEVKAHPSDVQRRWFLFELLCFAGDYERAKRQLDVVIHQDPASARKGQVLLAAEQSRQRLFSDGLRPALPSDTPAYVYLFLDALDRLRAGETSEALSTLEEGWDLCPAVSGRFNGEPFADLMDTHLFISPCLEVIINGAYMWLPFAHIRRLQTSAPKTVLDHLWKIASLETHDGSVSTIFIPVLYAGSSKHADEKVKLGRITVYKVIAGDLGLKAGQREFFVDDQERGLLELRELEIEPASEVGE